MPKNVSTGKGRGPQKKPGGGVIAYGSDNLDYRQAGQANHTFSTSKGAKGVHFMNEVLFANRSHG